MAIDPSTSSSRRIEAERLIGLARAMLTGPEEEMVTIYLDHALGVLHDLPADDMRSDLTNRAIPPRSNHG